MKLFWPLSIVALVALAALRVDAASGTCQAPSTPDPEDKPVEGCSAPQFWMDLRAGAQGGVSPTAVSATLPIPDAPKPAPRVPLPPVGSGAGAPMVMDEGMGRQEIKPDDSQMRMMRTAGKAAAMRGEAIPDTFASDLNYLQGYAEGQVERAGGGVRP
jgi:hypothetical protein